MVEVFGLIEQYDETHSLKMEAIVVRTPDAFVNVLQRLNSFVISDEMRALQYV